MPQVKEKKLCVRCYWCNVKYGRNFIGEYHINVCSNPLVLAKFQDPVIGGYVNCDEARENPPCGPDGLLFESAAKYAEELLRG
ncbi:MAG: hypothetical protein ACTSQ8_26020 [Candidatus Helarchaeota archaeon]